MISSDYVHTRVADRTGVITLDRPKALNSLSLDMVRALTAALLAWRDDAAIDAVVIGSSSEKALCAGGDIRFFHEAGHASPTGGSALLEDFFTEEYALNHLIHFYDKPYVSLMDGVVMGGGMGIAQGGPDCGLRVVTDRTKMAMPEVNIGLFPDVGGSHFLSHAPGGLGMYLGLTGLTVGAADALYVGLADVFVPGDRMAALHALIDATPGAGLPAAIRAFAAPFAGQAGPGVLQAERDAVDRHFGAPSVAAIMASLEGDASPFAQKALQAMRQRSPLMMCVTHAMLTRAAGPGRGRLPAHGTRAGAPQFRARRSAGRRARTGDRQGQCAGVESADPGRRHAGDGGALLRTGVAGVGASAAPPRHMIRWSLESRLAAAPADVWQWVTSVQGLDAEMAPLLRMTFPDGVASLSDLDFAPGRRVCRYRLLGFGVLPLDRSDLTFLAFEPGAASWNSRRCCPCARGGTSASSTRRPAARC